MLYNALVSVINVSCVILSEMFLKIRFYYLVYVLSIHIFTVHLRHWQIEDSFHHSVIELTRQLSALIMSFESQEKSEILCHKAILVCFLDITADVPLSVYEVE